MDTPGSYELPKPFMFAAFGVRSAPPVGSRKKLAPDNCIFSQAQCAVVVVDATTILRDQHKIPEVPSPSRRTNCVKRMMV